MAEKNLVNETLLQIQNLEEVINENAKEILASTMKEEISELVKESMKNEAEEDEFEVEDELESEDEAEEEDEFESEDESEELFSSSSVPYFLYVSRSVEPTRMKRISQKPFHTAPAHKLSLCCSLRI